MNENLKRIICMCLCISLGTSNILISNAETKNISTANEINTANADDTNKTEETPSSDNNQVESNTNSDGYIPPNRKSETIYVNLDNYGVPTETQVVNSYRIDGEKKIVDYGNYTKITNLTNFAKPEVNGDQIVWNLEEDVTNFYYQGTIDQMEMPWNFTIRYKLNGVETKAEELAGAAGMIETIIDVEPNENVSDYLKNNFFMQVQTSFDMGKCLSVEAPDSVMVTLGATKSITFMAMPGQKTSFHILVGTDSYESTGVNVIIAPLEMSAMDDIADLQDKKERVEKAFDAASENLDIIIDSANKIKGGLGALNSGLASMDSSLKDIRKDDAERDSKVEALLTSTANLSESIKKIAPHIDLSKEFITSVNSSCNIAVNDLNRFLPILSETKDSLVKLQNDCDSLADFVDEITEKNESLEKNMTTLKNRLSEVEKDLDRVERNLSNLEDSLDKLYKSLSNATGSLISLKNSLDKLSDMLTQKVTEMVMEGKLTYEQAQQIKDLQDKLGKSIGDIKNILVATSSLINDTKYVVSSTADLSGDLSNMNATLGNITTNIKGILATINDHSSDFTSTINNVKSLLGQLEKSTAIGTDMINDITETQKIVTNYIPELTSFMDDTKEVLINTGAVTDAATDLGNQVHSTVTDNRQNIYNSIDNTLYGSQEAINGIINSLGQTDALKENKDIIKSTIDDEWDKLEKDYNILNFDPEAKPVSLISGKNENINSIQIILRTPEISVDKAEKYKIQETEEEDPGIWYRVKNVINNLIKVYE